MISPRFVQALLPVVGVSAWASIVAAQTLAVPPATTPELRGTVYRDRDAAPVPGAVVLVLWQARDKDVLTQPPLLVETTTAADGRFVLPAVPWPSAAGAIDVSSSHVRSYARGYASESVAVGTATDAIRLPLKDDTRAPEQRARDLVGLASMLATIGAAGGGNPAALLAAVDAEWNALPASVRKGISSPTQLGEWMSAEMRSARQGDAVTAVPAVPGAPPPAYSARQIRLTVVDVNTLQPVQGVVIVAQWVLFQWGLGHGGHTTRALHIAEAVTDAAGRAVIDAWGPKGRPPMTQLTDRSPELLLLKHGYLPLRLRNDPDYARSRPNHHGATSRQISGDMAYEGHPHRAIQETFWDGKSITLEPFSGTRAAWLRRLERFAEGVYDRDTVLVAWPRALHAERERPTVRD